MRLAEQIISFHPMTVEQGLAMLSAFRCGGTMLIHASTYMFIKLVQGPEDL